MDYLCAEFGFGFIVQTDRQTDRQTESHTNADDRLTHAKQSASVINIRTSLGSDWRSDRNMA